MKKEKGKRKKDKGQMTKDETVILRLGTMACAWII